MNSTMDQIDAEEHANRLEAVLTHESADAFWRELADMLTSRTDNGKNACAAPLTNTIDCDEAIALTDDELFNNSGFRELVTMSAANSADMTRTPLEYVMQYATDNGAVDRMARGVLGYAADTIRQGASNMTVFAADNPATATRLAGHYITEAANTDREDGDDALAFSDEMLALTRRQRTTAHGHAYGLDAHDTEELTRVAHYWGHLAEQREDEGDKAGAAQARTAHALVCCELAGRNRITASDLAELIETMSGQRTFHDLTLNTPRGRQHVANVEELIDAATPHMTR